MAQRLAFYVREQKVYAKMVDFEWVPGLSVTQKKKSIANLHGKLDGMALEVSTKSSENIGLKLSAFNLHLDGSALENVFQSSKCFTMGGPYRDLLTVSPKEAKRDERLKSSGRLIGFNYNDEMWKLEPKTAFYDYIYIKAVKESIEPEEIQQVMNYEYFTDIEFNPKKSINTQQRSVAIIKAMLQMWGKIPEEMNRTDFLAFHRYIVRA